MTSRNPKEMPRIKDLEKRKKKRIKGIHFYTSLGTESVDVYSKSHTLFCHVGISIIIPTRP